MVRVDPVPKTFSILRRVTSLDEGNIIQIVRNDPNWLKSNAGITARYVTNGFLTDLSTYFSSDSLDKVPFPNYQVTDSEGERTLKTLNLVWGANTPKFYGQLWLSTKLDPVYDPLSPDTGDWVRWAKYSLINNEGYPYSIDEPLNLLTKGMSFDFDAPYSIGFSVLDADWGYLKTIDTLNIKGTWKQDNRVIQDDPVVPIIVQGGTVQQITQYRNTSSGTVGTTTRRLLLAANSKRIAATIKHGSTATNTVYIANRDITPSSTNNDGSVTAGSSYTVPSTYTGDVWGIGSTINTPYESMEIYNA